MAPIPNSETLDDLAVEIMDLQVALAGESNKTKHVDLIRKSLNRTRTKFQSVPEFEDGK